MEQSDLKNLLLETAVCTIACDGEIHELEISELNTMVSESIYFKGINGKLLLDGMLAKVKENSRNFFHTYLATLKISELSAVQELLVLEVALRIIYADKRFDENEGIFLRLVRSQLNLPDEIIVQRFGPTPYIAKAESIEFTSPDSQPALNSILTNLDNIQLNPKFKIEIPNIFSAETNDIQP